MEWFEYKKKDCDMVKQLWIKMYKIFQNIRHDYKHMPKSIENYKVGLGAGRLS